MAGQSHDAMLPRRRELCQGAALIELAAKRCGRARQGLYARNGRIYTGGLAPMASIVRAHGLNEFVLSPTYLYIGQG
jgi:hypothetical protein